MVVLVAVVLVVAMVVVVIVVEVVIRGVVVMYGGGVTVCPEHDKHLSKNSSLPPLCCQLMARADEGGG